LQARILVFVLVALAAVQIVVFFVVDAATTRWGSAQLRDDLAVGGQVFQRLLTARAEQLAAAARLLSGDFAFKTAYATGDRATISSALENQQLRIGANMMALVGRDSRVVAETLRLPGERFPFPALITAAERGTTPFAVEMIDGHPYQVVVVPLLAPMPVAWIAVGFVVDDRLMTELRRVTNSHVTFAVPREGGGWAMPASTLPPAARAALAAAMPKRLEVSAAGAVVHRIGHDDYLLHVVGLSGSAQAVAVLQTSLTEALAPAKHLRWILLGVFAGSLVLCAAGAIVVARTLTRPVRALVRGVDAVASGDYTHRVAVGNTDEFARLAGAMNHMTATIAEREEALRQSEDRLRQAQKMEAVGLLAGGIAHDFNNLLTVMLGRIELVLDELPEGMALRHEVLLVQGAAERAATLTRQLLAFGRKQVLQTRLVDINQVVGNFEGMLERLIGEQVILTTRLEGGLRDVMADPNQIEQILVNLVINARDAMPDGGTITIETTNGTMPGSSMSCAVISVRDTGTGMTPEVEARVFEPFFTTKEVGKGTGLGLATVYGIVKQHEGEIELETAPGRGSEFRVYLPYAGAAQEAPDEAVETPPASAGTVLIVEDEPEVRMLIARMLRREGYDVLEAGDGESAIQVAKGPERIDLLLTDVVMPGMSGSELTRIVKELRADIKVIYMSGYTHDMIERHGVFAPGTAFLQKPFSARALSRAVHDVMAGD
jgi:signal transduction histidine kinase/CheY-like chemotaxis protein